MCVSTSIIAASVNTVLYDSAPIMAVAAERGRGRHRRENEGEVNARREEGEVVKDRENNNYNRQNGCQDMGRKGRRDELEANPQPRKPARWQKSLWLFFILL